MNDRIKNRITFSIYNLNNNDKKKIFLKRLKKQTGTKKLISSTNAINLSINPSNNKNYSIKHALSVKTNNNYKTLDSTRIRINPNNNTINSSMNYKNKSNEINKNYETNDLNIGTIHSNGKFNNNKQLRCNIRKRLFEKNTILSNNYINSKLNKNLSLKLSLSNKDNKMRDNWKGLNISSHYLGNTTDNKFGIITNKFCVNKNILLTGSNNNLKLKQNHDTTSIIVERNNQNIKKIFKTLNIPNHNNYFNGIGTTNFFPRIKSVINNENLYNKLSDQMTIVFNKKIKEYSLHKSNEKSVNASSQTNNDFFRKTLKNIKQQNLFNYEYVDYKRNKENLSPLIDRHDSILLKNVKKFKINEEKKNIYKAINIKSNSNKNININFELNQNDKNINN